MENVKLLLQYDLQLFAKDGPGGEKTEPATAKKISDARKEGQVAKSKDLGNGVMLVALFLILKVFVSNIGETFVGTFAKVYTKMGDLGANSGQDFDLNMAKNTLQTVMIDMLLVMAPVFAIAVVSAVVIDIIQVKWTVTTKPLQPKFSKINPLSGFKRIFSVQSLVTLIKSVLIVGALVYVIYLEIRTEIGALFNFYDRTLQETLQYLGDLVINIGLKVSIVLLVIGIADYIFQYIKFKNDLKMTKQEIKDEYKNSEGDPQVKSQQKRRMMQASQRRMMQSVPQADVIITNPTHFAVAIQYDALKAKAPVVLAKGEDFLAAKIKDVAKENNITIVENKPLARMLYYNVDVGMEIPPELYQAVAEVLAFVYKAKNKQVYRSDR